MFKMPMYRFCECFGASHVENVYKLKINLFSFECHAFPECATLTRVVHIRDAQYRVAQGIEMRNTFGLHGLLCIWPSIRCASRDTHLSDMQ